MGLDGIVLLAQRFPGRGGRSVFRAATAIPACRRNDPFFANDFEKIRFISAFAASSAPSEFNWIGAKTRAFVASRQTPPRSVKCD
jgi:hypothetical protein